eukprot:TRINITY_DN7337_c0_g1_i1.p1 TRINITY_DN7337_c0_g1~~TRINITY_DN7337_c0_g1_i1.p1  ORF type:complete len:75 (+),score=4.50 TRINITY_DN7337_c0_g1_i1:375-599(+)
MNPEDLLSLLSAQNDEYHSLTKLSPSLRNYDSSRESKTKRLERFKEVLVCCCKSSHVLCVDTGRSSETAKAHRG